MTSIPIPPPLPSFVQTRELIEMRNNTIKKNKNIKYIGLQNQGSTCYLNALIQSLFMTPEFRYNIFQWKYDNNIHGNLKDSIPFQLQKLFYRLQNPIRKIEQTVDLTKSFQWNNNEVYIQQDIEELCRVLFEAIEISIGTYDNFINQLYRGNYQSIIQCLECNNKSVHEDFFLDLSLPILNMFENIHNKSLGMALMNFIKPERLEKDNQYFCSKCNKKVDADKYMKFEKFPKILFIQLGRFYYDFQIDLRNKLNNKVPFPLILNCNKYLKNYKDIEYNPNEDEDDKFCLQYSEELINKYLNEGPYVYELFSIVIQSGSANGGHYYAYIKSFEDNKWYNFNDSNVTEINVESIINVYGNDNVINKNYSTSNTAYCLMYRKISKDDKNYTINDMVVNDILINIVKDENEEIIKREKEREEKMNQTNLTFFKDDMKKIIPIKKTSTFFQLKEKLIEEFSLKEPDSLTFKIREYNSMFKNGLEYIEGADNDTLEQIYFSAYKHYLIQLPDDKGNFPIYDPSLIELNIHLFNNEINSETPVEKYPLNKIKISINSKMNDLVNEIYKSLNLDINCKIFVLRRNDFGFGIEVTYTQIDDKYLYSDNDIYLKNSSQRGDLFIEIGDNITMSNSQWMKIFKKQKGNILIKFNNLNDNNFTNQIIGNKFDTIKEIKLRLCETLSLSPEKIILKKGGKNGEELYDFLGSLQNYIKGEKEFYIYIEEGNPLKENEVILNISMCLYDYEQYNIFPYKIENVNKVIIDKNKKILDLKNEILKFNNLPFQEDEDNTIIIRNLIGGKPGKIYRNDSIIKNLDFLNEMKLVVQNIPKNLIDYSLIENKNYLEDDIIQITLRYLNVSNWTLSNPVEILLKYSESIKSIERIILKYFPEINKEEDIQIIKIKCNMYFDEIIKMDFIDLNEYENITLDKYPFIIKNNGYVLIIKNKNAKIGEISEEIKSKFFKPEDKKNIPTPPDINSLSNNRVKNMINLFENGEFDLVTKTYKTIEDNKPKKPRIKEKGIVIKVKKIGEEEEEEKIEEKKEEKKEDKKKEDEKIEDNKTKKENNEKITTDIFDEIPPDIFDDDNDNENNIEPLI